MTLRRRADARILLAFLSCRRGIAAVEFALLVPFLILLYIGSVELLDGIRVHRQVTMASSTVANVVSQYTVISAGTQMPDILAASVQTIAPYPADRATIVVSSILIDGNGQATVAWSRALSGAERAVGEVVTLPPDLAVPDSTVILGEATYRYRPVVNFLQLADITIAGSTYMVPRAGIPIVLGQ